jgi:hypothetical protein
MSEQLDTEKLDQYITVMQSVKHDLTGRSVDRFYRTAKERKGYHMSQRCCVTSP